MKLSRKNSENKDAKYVILMLGSTSDIALEDKVSKILRYVHIDENKNVEIKETFLRFFKIDKKRCRKLGK